MNFIFTREAFDAVRSDIVNFVERCDQVVGGYLCSIDLLAVWDLLDRWAEMGIPFFGWVGRLRARSLDREWYSYIIVRKGGEVERYVEMFKEMGIEVVEKGEYVVAIADFGTWRELFNYIQNIPYGSLVGYGLGKYIA